MRDVARAGPPPAAGEYVPVLRIRTVQPRKLLILSTAIWAFHTHWVGNRTVPCESREEDFCRCPFAKFPQKWMGYLYYWEAGVKWGFVELTPGVANAMLAMLDDGQMFRGKAFEFWRSSNGKGARHHVARRGHEDRNPEELPQDRDPKELLLKLWGAPKRTTC
jgi:hypothetical protein